MTPEKHGGNIYKFANKLGLSTAKIYDFSININPLGTQKSIHHIIKKNIGALMQYPDPDYREFKETISLYHKISPDYVIPGNGANELIYLYARVIKPKKCLIVAPTFSEYARALNEAGSQTHFFKIKEEDSFTLNTDKMIEEMENGYNLIVICNPNNPTGNVYPKSDMERIVSTASKTNTRVMIDESFMEFIEESEKYSIVNGTPYKNIFILRSLTKILAIPGLRLGYALSYDPILNKKLLNGKDPWTINTLASKTAQVMINSHNYIKKTRITVKKEKEFIIKNLKALHWIKIYPSAVNYLLIKITNGITAQDLQEKLLEDKILIRNASNFLFLDETFIRIAVKDRKSNIYLIKSLKKLF